MIILVAGLMAMIASYCLNRVVAALNQASRLEARQNYLILQDEIRRRATKNIYCKPSFKILAPLPATFSPSLRVPVSVDLSSDVLQPQFFSSGVLALYPGVNVTSLELRDLQDLGTSHGRRSFGANISLKGTYASFLPKEAVISYQAPASGQRSLFNFVVTTDASGNAIMFACGG